MSRHEITLSINGEEFSAHVPARKTLLDFLRQDAGLTGTHAGCEHGVCGACTVMMDGAAVRSCLIYAVQAEGTHLRTVEGLAMADGTLHPVQAELRRAHGLQCGFCTPGIAMTLTALTEADPPASGDDIRAAMSGHVCRCTGYQGILRAIGVLAGENPPLDADAQEAAHG